MSAIRFGNGVFDIWRPGYGGATVTAYIAGTTTKASLYEDEALTVAASNPQVLQIWDQNGGNYGKLTRPLYTSSAHFLSIDSAENTGIIRPPLTTLVDQDASDADVTPTGGSVARPLEDLLADAIQAENYGQIGPLVGASTNNATITAAANAAAALGGGAVLLPEGALPFNSLTLAAGVVLVGRGRGVTTLQSQTAGKVITFGGDRAGLANLTLDGVAKAASSIGVYSKAKNETYFREVEVKRFETGIQQQGGRRPDWSQLYIENCATGVKWHGDNDASNGANGDELRYSEWRGGRVTNCTSIGVELKYVDKKIWNTRIADVGFEDNTGTALKIEGARFTKLPGCWWKGNTADILIQDGSDTTRATENTVIGVHFDGGSISGGTVTLKNTLQDVIFDKMDISDVDFTLTTPINNVVLRDCTEDSSVTVAGDGTKLTRCRTMLADYPASAGVTTDNTATKAWSYSLAPGEVIHIEAVVIGNARNGEDRGIYHIARSARRPGSTLAYDAQTANFTLGATLTGAISGATARIVADSDSGATGTLTLRDINGDFLDNETISDSSGGSATANGTLTSANAALLGSTTVIETAVEADAAWACDFAASGTEVQIQVTGNSGDTIEWTVSTKVTSG